MTSVSTRTYSGRHIDGNRVWRAGDAYDAAREEQLSAALSCGALMGATSKPWTSV